MTSKRRWLWVILFILAVLLTGGLATSWNMVLVSNYLKIEELKHALSATSTQENNPWIAVSLGTLGFVTLLGGLVLFFFRLLREMKLTQFQSEFLAAVSHELKTPIATLELTSSLLKQSQMPEQEKEKLWAAHTAELNRLKRDVADLLETLHWDAGPIAIQPQLMELNSWLQAKHSRWEQILSASDGKAQLQLDSQKIRFQSDPRQLELILQNLIENSKKFAQGKPEIEIKTELLSQKQWRLSVRDHGWGIEPHELKKIFRRFYRAPTAATYSISGTGLGLHLVASACKAMKIKIHAEIPKSGSGACFVLEGKCTDV